MREEFPTEVVNDGFADLEGQPLAVVEAELGDPREKEEPDGAERDCFPAGPMGDGTIDDRPGRPGDERQLDRPEDDKQEQRVPQAGVRTHIRKQTSDQPEVEWPPVDLAIVGPGAGQGEAEVRLSDTIPALAHLPWSPGDPSPL